VTALLVVGIALVAFGALILLLFPDRPGGQIAWQGFQVSSIGAGLPIIVVGVVSIGFAGVRGVGGDNAAATLAAVQDGREASATPAQETTAGTGSEACFRDIPEEEHRTVEVGTRDFELVRPDQPKGEPVWIVFTDLENPIGGLRFRFLESNTLFRILSVVDADCSPVEPVENVSRGGDPYILENWDVVRLQFGDAFYDLRIGAESDIKLDYFQRVEPP
jgi:hypothetical protein